MGEEEISDGSLHWAVLFNTFVLLFDARLLKSKRRNQSLPMDFVLLVLALVFGALNHGAIETARAFIFSKPPGVRTVSSKERLTYKTSQELQNNAKQCGS